MKFYNHSIPIVFLDQLCNKKASYLPGLQQHSGYGLISLDDILFVVDNLQIMNILLKNLTYWYPISDM